MNIHVVFNEGQRVLLEDYFAPSLKDDWRLITHPLLNYDQDQNFGTQGFKEIMYRKVQTLINDIIPQEISGDGFVLSDIDIQFFRPCAAIIETCLKQHDIVFQRECPHTREANCGFIAMRPTPEVINFWNQVEAELKDALDSPIFTHEQKIANTILETGTQLNWGFLPNEIWAWSNSPFFPSVDIPWDICLHHANCTEPKNGKSSMERKIEQLDLVRDTLQGQKKSLKFKVKNLLRNFIFDRR